ncbi:threonine/homoserine efflux transporter RhtA [Luteococcus japonicus]|uniref:Permease of the drug/metabolite transporter (DMT) superfamily n=2 Tax=Luteococcus japonicus TaxID=33984 RepID=A0A1R4KKE9_9ACTN|nr:DMT family transporter [Luteococcus japonicus]ROR55018.1 threonine/homoserine efflux transporter RhtA [Luteococcus japonicus]SJN44504.1 Permease of the drug/metabolite transporter (DMT) superfamily [Luteococcus japonicus LSP_Lj1]
MTQQLRASLALVGSMLLFAASYTMTKVALVDLGPMTLGAVRFLLATAVIAAVISIRRGWQRPTRDDARTLAVGGLLGVTAYFALENLGVHWATATDATLLAVAIPAIIAVCDVLANGAVIARRGWLGIAVAMVGAGFIVFGAPISTEAGPRRLWGALLILLAGVAWAFYTFATRDVATRYSSWTTVLWQDGAGALAFIPLALLEAPGWHRPTRMVPTLAAVLALTLLCSVLAMVLYAIAVRQLPTALVAASINLEPIFGLLIAVVVLGERVSPAQMLGGVVVVCGVWLTHRP